MRAEDEVFIVRKPVLDRANQVYGYKLLHTSTSHLSSEDGESASALQLVHDSVLVFDLNALASGKKVFLSFTQETLETECFELLPKESTVIDLHPSLSSDPDNVAACRRLKEAGYLISAPLQEGAPRNPLLDLADIVTLDFRQWPSHQLNRDRIAELGGRRTFLAHSVDSLTEYQLALDLGCAYVEGKYFSQPKAVAGRGMPGFKPSYLKLLRAINQAEPDFKTLAAIIAPEVSLTYKLLRLVNSAIYGIRNKVNSVDRALLMLGERGIRQWAALIAMSELAANIPAELVTTSAIRGRFCQTIGQTLGMSERTDDLFLMGLFSLLDVITGRPLAGLLDELGIDSAVKEALMGRANDLRPIYELVMAYEQGYWAAVVNLGRCMGLERGAPAELYVQSVEWANFSLNLTA